MPPGKSAAMRWSPPSSGAATCRLNSVRLFGSAMVHCDAAVLMQFTTTRSTMSTIPVSLTEEQFTTHIKPHLSVAKRGFQSEQPLWKIFNLVLYVLHTGCQWPETPVPKG